MKKIIVLLILVVLLTACGKYFKRAELNKCDCLYGYNVKTADYSLDDLDVTKKLHRKLLIPKGTSEFWYFCGKNMNYINWPNKLYVYKTGDMDYRIVVIDEKVFTISEDDEDLNDGLIQDDSISARWGNGQLSLIFKKMKNGERGFFHEIYFEDKTYIGVITFYSKKRNFIDSKTEFQKYDYIKLDKYNNTLIECQNKTKRIIRPSDCRGI